MSLQALAGSLVNAYIAIEPPGVGVVNFKFNPQEYKVTKSAEWHSTPQPSALNGGTAQFHGSIARTLSVNILLDAFAIPPEPIEVQLDTLYFACDPTPESIALGDPMPPTVLFGWGANTPFNAYLKSVDVTYKLFLPTGTPVRAEVAVTMQEIPTILPPTNPTSGGRATQRTHTMIDGETLPTVAYAVYGNPTRWRGIAELNGIDDPLRVKPGTVLVLPDRAEAEALR